MIRQFEILDKLAQILSDEADCRFQSLFYKGEINIAEGWTESTFSFVMNDEQRSLFLSDGAEERISALITELHGIMKNQTGGSWKWMTFIMEEDRESKVHYAY